MGRISSKQYSFYKSYCKHYPSNRDLPQKIWQIDSSGTVAIDDPSLLPLDERRALKILESVFTKTEDIILLVCCEKKTILSYQKTEIRIKKEKLEKIFKRDPALGIKYKPSKTT